MLLSWSTNSALYTNRHHKQLLFNHCFPLLTLLVLNIRTQMESPSRLGRRLDFESEPHDASPMIGNHSTLYLCKLEGNFHSLIPIKMETDNPIQQLFAPHVDIVSRIFETLVTRRVSSLIIDCYALFCNTISLRCLILRRIDQRTQVPVTCTCMVPLLLSCNSAQRNPHGL